MRKPNGSGIKWAECSLIIGTGYWVQLYSLILDISVGLPTGIQSAGDSVPETLVRISCIQQRKTTCLLSIKKSLTCAWASQFTTTNKPLTLDIYIYIINHEIVATREDEIHRKLSLLWPNCSVKEYSRQLVRKRVPPMQLMFSFVAYNTSREIELKANLCDIREPMFTGDFVTGNLFYVGTYWAPV